MWDTAVCNSATLSPAPSTPGTIGTPACSAISRDLALLFINSIASGLGLMKTTPRAAQAVAKVEFSLKKP